MTALNEQICRLRPLESEPGGWSEEEKKTAAAIHQEVTREVQTLLQVVFGAPRKSPALDLEAVEMAVRSAMHRAGAGALSRLLSMDACRRVTTIAARDAC